MNDGYQWVVDIDLEKFFDNVPHDKLMSYVHNIINDGDVESLIRKYLQAGVMSKGRYEATNQSMAASKINIRVITPRARQRSGNEGSLPSQPLRTTRPL